MNDMPMYIASGIGVLLIVLGFVALLAQRIYLDSRTQSPIEIDLPLLGKMKANYPALFFVFLGCALTVFGVQQQHKAVREVQWQIDGTIEADAQQINWQQGRLEVFPTKVETEIDPATGRFKIKLAIEEGKTLEDVVERIDYSHRTGSVVLLPKKELEQFKKKSAGSLLTEATNTSRTYKMPLGQFPPLNN